VSAIGQINAPHYRDVHVPGAVQPMPPESHPNTAGAQAEEPYFTSSTALSLMYPAVVAVIAMSVVQLAVSAPEVWVSTHGKVLKIVTQPL
jgi:hypothetical protein